MSKDKDCCNSKSEVQLLAKSDSNPMHVETSFSIRGADCSDEVIAIKKALQLPNISSVDVNLIAATVTVRHDKSLDQGTIKKLVRKTGVEVVEIATRGFYANNARRVHIVLASGVFLLLGVGLALKANAAPILSLIFFSISTVLAGSLVFPKAFRALKQRTLDMNVLMTIAVAGAFAIGEYSEAATVVFLFSLAELLEAFSVSRARDAIREVLKLTPQFAHLKQNGSLVSTPVSELQLDNIVVVLPGESIPIDGNVIEGMSSVNQAPLTGESTLVEKKIGDRIFAGTVNGNGALTIEVTQVFKDTKISRVLRMIEEAQAEKAPTERFVDQFAKIYTPVVFVAAILVCLVPTILFNQPFDIWFYRAHVLLVIACPCALVISTPVSVVSGLSFLAKRGVLVMGGKYLEAVGKIRAIAMDKTGTLTEGKFRVHDLITLGQAQVSEVLKVAGGLESLSTHPLAKAVLDYSKARDSGIPEMEDYRVVPGLGTEGSIGPHRYFAGNHRFAHDLGVCSKEVESALDKIESQSLSVVIVGRKPDKGNPGAVLGIFSLGDKLRSNAQSAIASLHEIGIKKIVVLSGDNQKTVDAICKLAGIDVGLGDLLPEDKVREVKKLRGEFTEIAMVGDGVNDAPALAHATLGVSMGAGGTDATIETSDVALMQDNLEELPKAILQGRRVLAVIRFNIFFAMATKAAFLVLAISGYTNLWLAVAADTGASLLVTANALRLLRK
ncbi:MAG: heavy metal translocating P-type ATPase [Bdellovibrionales bacterium]